MVMATAGNTKHTKISSEEISDGRKYSLLFHYELTVPDRTFTGRKGDQREKIKTLNETKDLF